MCFDMLLVLYNAEQVATPHYICIKVNYTDLLANNQYTCGQVFNRCKLLHPQLFSDVQFNTIEHAKLHQSMLLSDGVQDNYDTLHLVVAFVEHIS